MTACTPTCTRIRVALAEQDLEDAQRRVLSAHVAIHAAEDALDAGRAELDRAQQAVWLRRGDLHRAKRDAA